LTTSDVTLEVTEINAETISGQFSALVVNGQQPQQDPRRLFRRLPRAGLSPPLIAGRP
jgi:hypothetical protein